MEQLKERPTTLAPDPPSAAVSGARKAKFGICKYGETANPAGG